MKQIQKYLHLPLRAVLMGVFSITILTASAQVDKILLEKAWVAIDSRPEGDDWVSPIDGAIVYFKDGKGELAHIGSDSVRSFAYELKKSVVYINDTLEFGRIRHLSADSMTMKMGKSMVTQFLPLKNYKLTTDAQELIEMLLNNAWYRTPEEQKTRIDFFAPSFYPENSRFRVCIAHHRSKYWSYRETESWSVTKYRGTLLMSISQGQFDLNIHQIKSVRKSFLEAELLTTDGYYPVGFEVLPTATDNQLQRLKNIVVAHEWTISEIKYHHPSEAFADIDSSYVDMDEPTGWSLSADNMILKSNFLKKKLIYQFSSDGLFEIKNGTETVKEGSWALSKDGRFIILNHPTNPLNYLKIVEATEDYLLIEQTVELRVSDDLTEYISYHCKISLR